jgi:translation initiation factor 4G
MFAALADDNASSSKPEPLSEEKLQRKIKSMTNDFISDGGNIDELLLSWEEISGTPDAGKEFVIKQADRMMDCKDNEREAIYRIIAILCEKGKLSRGDVQDGLMDAVEFIDSLILDSPRAYEYLGDLLGDMLRLNMVDMSWLSDQLKKIDPSTEAPEKVVRFTLLALKKSAGRDVAKAQTGEKKLTDLLGADTLKSISQEL